MGRRPKRPYAHTAALNGELPCDILLIQPPIRDYYLTAKRTIPYGLLSIAAALRRAGFRVALLDALARSKSRPAPLPAPLAGLTAIYPKEDRSPFSLFREYRHFGYALETIGAMAGGSGAFLIGISSLFSAYEDMALACARAVKNHLPAAFVVLGGHHPTHFPERLLDHPSVDFVLRGDGETALPLLAQVLRRKAAPTEVPGIAFDDQAGRRRIHPPVYVRNLERLAPPPTDLLPSRHYRRSGKASLTIAASRGCPMACSYCCMGAYSHIPYRRRSIAHVMGEIARAAEKQTIGLIDFEDEHLAMDRPWFVGLLRGIVRYFAGSPPELRAMNGLYPPALDHDVVALMREAGFRQLNLSLASCSRRQVRRFHRPHVAADFDRTLKWARKQAMTAVGYLIAGAPGQTPQSSLDDLLFLAPRRVLAGLSTYYPAPGSLDFERCRSANLLPRSPLAWRASAFPLDGTTGRWPTVTLARLARTLNFMKRCVDVDGRLPFPDAVPNPPPRLSGTRYQIGRRLLRWFMADGVLRAVDACGRVSACPTDLELTRAFLRGIEADGVRGVIG